MRDKFVNIIFWTGFLVAALIAVVGGFIGLALLCAVGIAGIVLGAGALIVLIVPVLPFVCWCAMFERQRWESFIRMIQSQKPTTN
jgi:hypothetical protein